MSVLDAIWGLAQLALFVATVWTLCSMVRENN